MKFVPKLETFLRNLSWQERDPKPPAPTEGEYQEET